MATKPVSFEQSMQNLEQLVERLEQGQLPLDESLNLFKQGIKTAKVCQQQLDQAQQVVQEISQDTDTGTDIKPTPKSSDDK